MEAHHYVSQLNEDFHQATIFDGNGKAAKSMGVEYIISEKLFKILDEEEKALNFAPPRGEIWNANCARHSRDS